MLTVQPSVAVPAHHDGPRLREQRVAGLQRFGHAPRDAALDVTADRERHVVGREEAAERRGGIGERARVGHRRPRSDDVGGIADHVGQDERPDAGGLGGGAQEAAALHPRAVLPHRVERRDVRAREKQPARDVLLVPQLDPLRGRDEERGSAAREHDEDERRRVGRGDRVEELSRRRLPGRIGHGMSPRFDGDRADRRHVEPTRHDDAPPAQRGADDLRHRLRHAPRRLPRSDDEHRPGVARPHAGAETDRVVHAAEPRRDEPPRPHGVDRGSEAVERVAPKLRLRHGARPTVDVPRGRRL